MNIILFTHPEFLGSQSMPRFANLIEQGMLARGHSVEKWTAKPFFYRLPLPRHFKKWLGYLDQFIVFPLQVRLRLRQLPRNTLFVFADQALGPWVPLVATLPHVIHVHDFMALRSSLGEVSENRTGWSGRRYQAFIRRGFNHGKNFTSVSKKTRSDLHRFLTSQPQISEVVYNGLNFPFHPIERRQCLIELSPLDVEMSPLGFLLHVGGNQWYKNRSGVLEIYEAYVRQVENPLPLWMIGAPPTDAMKAIAERCISDGGKVLFLDGITNEQVCAAYSLASLMLFPSLEEGFGWPIAEAMACGCLVLTTGEAPMNEVGGDAAFYIPRKPVGAAKEWADDAGRKIIEILSLSPKEKSSRQAAGFNQVAQFDTERTISAYETIYRRIVDGE